MYKLYHYHVKLCVFLLILLHTDCVFRSRPKNLCHPRHGVDSFFGQRSNFCPARMAGTQPRLNCDFNGHTTVANFREVFADTGEEDLLLELFQKLEICLRFGDDLRQLVIPSLMTSEPPVGCWTPSTNNSSIVSTGLCLKCHHPVSFSPTFFPRLQIRLYNMWLLNYGLKIQLWQGGLKLVQTCPGSRRMVEAVVVLANDSFDTHVVVRSHQDDMAAGLALREVLTQQIYDVAEAVSQGSQVDRQVLGIQSTREYSTDGRTPMVHFTIPELRQACEERRPPVPVRGIGGATTTEDAIDHLLHIDAMDCVQPTADQSPASLLDDETMRIIDECVRDNWNRLATELGFTAQEILRWNQKASNKNENMVIILLRHWQRRLTADFPELIAALERSCPVDHRVVAVDACRKRQRVLRQSVVGGTFPPLGDNRFGHSVQEFDWQL